MKKTIIIVGISLIFLIVLLFVVYHYIVYPYCDPKDTAVRNVSMSELVNNAGMDKEKFLDVDGKSYCDTITYAACVEKNKWKFKTYIKCKDYEESEAFNWENFDPEF